MYAYLAIALLALALVALARATGFAIDLDWDARDARLDRDHPLPPAAEAWTSYDAWVTRRLDLTRRDERETNLATHDLAGARA